MSGTIATIVLAGSVGLIGWVPGPAEIVVLLLLIVLIFGARKLPEIGRGLGEGIRNFRGSMKELSGSDSDTDEKKDRAER